MTRQRIQSDGIADAAITTAKINNALVINCGVIASSSSPLPTIQNRRDTAANIAVTNPVLAAGEVAYETDTRRWKIGDGTTAWNSLAYGSGNVTNGNKGDITVSAAGETWTINAGAVVTADIADAGVTYAKMQNVSATDRLLGRSTAGAGVVEEITCTAAARNLLDDTTAAAMLTTLGASPAAATSALQITATGAMPEIFYAFSQPLTLLLSSGAVAYTGKWVSALSVQTAANSTASLTFGDLEGVVGTLSLLPNYNTNTVGTAVSCPALIYAGGINLSYGAFPMGLGSISLPVLRALGQVGFTISTISTSTLQSGALSFPALEWAQGGISTSSLTSYSSLSLPVLTYVGGNGIQVAGSYMNALSAPALKSASSINITSALQTLNLPALEHLSNNITLPNGLQNFTVGNLKAIGDISATNTALTQTAVNHILDKLAALDGTNGTMTYGTGRNVNLSNTSNGWGATATATVSGGVITGITVTNGGQRYTSAPTVTIIRLNGASSGTNAGAAAILTGNAVSSFTITNGGTNYVAGQVAVVIHGNSPPSGSTTNVTLQTSPTLPNLSCSGTTCTVNMTNHGYVTGDVLRIANVQTATNANRIAIITVVNANQFTYTITSQTAAGTGTATILKANNSLKTLVTRGVTVSVNL